VSEEHPAALVVQRYIDLSGALDASGLTECFASNASLNGYLGPKPVVGGISLYIDDVRRLAESGAVMSAYRASITMFAVTGDVATATVSMEGFAGAQFVDYLHLMQHDGAWRIVAKTFTTV